MGNEPSKTPAVELETVERIPCSARARRRSNRLRIGILLASLVILGLLFGLRGGTVILVGTPGSLITFLITSLAMITVGLAIGVLPSTDPMTRDAFFALVWKEWREQRWRFLLGTMVVTGLMAGLMRAQVIAPREAALFVCWPVGIVMTIFLAMGPVASERADRTWEFLVAQPVRRSDVLLAKWLVGLLQLTAMMLIATAAGMLALWSRTRHYFPFRPGLSPADMSAGWYHDLSVLHVDYPVTWLGCYGLIATLTLLCCYTPLFFTLSRARNEFTAALGGILLVIVAHAWVFQAFVGGFNQPGLLLTGSLSPLSPLILHPLNLKAWWPDLGVLRVANVALILWPVHFLVWIVVPVYLVRRCAGRAVAA